MGIFTPYSPAGSSLGSIIESHMSDPGDEEMKREVKLFLRVALIDKVLVIALLLFGLGSMFVNVVFWRQANTEPHVSLATIQDGLFTVGLIAFVFYIIIKKVHQAKLDRYLKRDCRPDKVLNYIYYVATMRKRHSRSMPFVCVAARMMVYLGRFDDASRLLTDTVNLLSEDRERFLYSMAAADLALDCKDVENASTQIGYADALVSVKSKPVLAKQLLARKQRLEMLIIEVGGSTEQLYLALDYYNQIASMREGSTFESVRASYHFARLTSDAQMAHEAYTYAAEYGGTTWYAAEAKKNIE